VDGVIGPDEYHEGVEDNAFTNVMARWNLRAAARLAGAGVSRAERDRWVHIADALVDGYDPVTGCHEQFAGYFALDPLLVRELGTPPLAADLLAGRERIAASQVIKQPDALMLHVLVPDELVPGSLQRDLELYLPRTAHGSSLSPASCAHLLARAGRPDEALDLLTLAIEVDLHDEAGTSAAGVHLAAAAGAWRAVLAGFLGIRVRAGVLEMAPCVPAAWRDLEVRFCALGAHLRVRLGDGALVVSADRQVRVARAGELPVDVPGGHREIVLEGVGADV
jgi:trehalose/maltose hydrolase-like predicted phosphorylase